MTDRKAESQVQSIKLLLLDPVSVCAYYISLLVIDVMITLESQKQATVLLNNK